MKKADLLKMDRLTATPDMMRYAKNDSPAMVTLGYREMREQYQYDLYLRCRVQNGILKVSLFWTGNMHKGGNLPIYEVYFSREEKNLSPMTAPITSGWIPSWTVLIGRSTDLLTT